MVCSWLFAGRTLAACWAYSANAPHCFSAGHCWAEGFDAKGLLINASDSDLIVDTDPERRKLRRGWSRQSGLRRWLWALGMGRLRPHGCLRREGSRPVVCQVPQLAVNDW